MTTAVPALDARNTIPARLERLGINQRFFSELCGISQTEFSRYMSGDKPLGGGQTEKFYQTLSTLEELATLFHPMQVRFKDAATVKEWLHSPTLPNLFALLTEAQKRAQQADEDSKHIRQQWLEFLDGGR